MIEIDIPKKNAILKISEKDNKVYCKYFARRPNKGLLIKFKLVIPVEDFNLVGGTNELVKILTKNKFNSIMSSVEKIFTYNQFSYKSYKPNGSPLYFCSFLNQKLHAFESDPSEIYWDDVFNRINQIIFHSLGSRIYRSFEKGPIDISFTYDKLNPIIPVSKTEIYNDGNLTCVKEYNYNLNQKQFFILKEIYKKAKGTRVLHCETGPAEIFYQADGTVKTTKYWFDGVLLERNLDSFTPKEVNEFYHNFKLIG